ncbi:MAG: AEC family transporter [Pseudomonadota bacterium]
MEQVFAIVAPVFALMALGWTAVKTGFLGKNVELGLSAFSLWVAIPALLFRLTSEAEVPEVAPWAFWLPFLIAGACVWVTAVVLARALGRPRTSGPAFAMAAAYGNTVMLGIPVCLNAFGEAAALPIALLTAVHAPVLWLASTVQYEWVSSGPGKSAWQLLTELVIVLAKNPVVMAILAGTAWGATGLGLHPVINDIITQLGHAAIPSALFALGMSLAAYSLRREMRAAPALTLIKLGAMPAIVWLLVQYVFVLPPVWAGTAVIMAATPTGMNAYLFASRYDTSVPSVTSTIVLSTALSVAVLPLAVLLVT